MPAVLFVPPLPRSVRTGRKRALPDNSGQKMAE
jgi:hypothetical protein